MSSLAALLKRLGLLPAVAVALLLIAPSFAEARVGGGGSRGFKTWTSPPSTGTAPKGAQPMERSITPQTGKPSTGAVAGAAQAARPSMFGGIGKFLMGGLIAGALASMFGFGALAGVLGFLLQMALIAGIVMLAMAWWRNRSSGQPATAAAGMGRQPRPAPQNAYQREANYRDAGAAAPVGASPAGHASASLDQPVAVEKPDYDAFERLLADIQSSFGRGDLKALEFRTTPEMYSYLAADLAANAKRGVRNEVSDAKLLQGDLADAWREGNIEYATVAMRFSLIDATVDLASGRVVDGSRTEPQEATEVWTFSRPFGAGPDKWELSAVQQA